MTARRLTSLLIALLFSFTCAGTAIPAANANGNCVSYFSGQGTGTSGDPYLVDSRLDLEEVNFCLSAHFRQTSNIDLGIDSWTPLGSYASRFTGIYNGGGFTVTGLSIAASTSDYQGLFGVIKEATIRDITVTGSISARNYVGGLVGMVLSGEISDAHSSVTVSGTTNVGSLVGGAYDVGAASTGPGTSISLSSASGNVSGQANVGGLVGSTLVVLSETIAIENSSASGNITLLCVAEPCGEYDLANAGGLIGSTAGSDGDSTGSTLITSSWVTGDVTASTSDTPLAERSYAIGGLIGDMSSAQITNSFASGDVQGGIYVGGLSGKLGNGFATGGSSVTDSYFSGSVTGRYQTGGVIGQAGAGVLTRTYSSATMILLTPGSQSGGFIGLTYIPGGHSLWDTTTSDQSSPGVGTNAGVEVTGKTTSEMKLQSTYAEIGWSISPYWNGGTTWAICSAYNNGYPYLVSTVSSNPSGCSLAPVPDPVPEPTPTPSSTPTPAPVTPTTESPQVPIAPVVQAEVRPLAPGIAAITGDVIAVTPPVRTDAPAGTTRKDAPKVSATTGEVIRVSIDGLAESSDVVVAIRINGRWVRLGTASTGVKGRTTLPAFETTIPGDYLMRIKGKGTGTRYLWVTVS